MSLKCCWKNCGRGWSKDTTKNTKKVTKNSKTSLQDQVFFVLFVVCFVNFVVSFLGQPLDDAGIDALALESREQALAVVGLAEGFTNVNDAALHQSQQHVGQRHHAVAAPAFERQWQLGEVTVADQARDRRGGEHDLAGDHAAAGGLLQQHL